MLLLQTGSCVLLTQLHHVDSLLQRFIISLGDVQERSPRQRALQQVHQDDEYASHVETTVG